jgi:hypothetical protein
VTLAMTKDDLRRELARYFKQRIPSKNGPTMGDWVAFRAHIGCDVPEAFVKFYDVLGEFRFEGELLEIAVDGDIRGPDTIGATREAEEQIGGWPSDMLPFFAIGNGDYLCLSTTEGPCSRVYVVEHEDRTSKTIDDAFEMWLSRLAEYFDPL